MDQTPDKLRERARALSHGPTETLRQKNEDAILSAFADVRREALEKAIRAVEDAGGDNEDYHADAIRALKDKQP